MSPRASRPWSAVLLAPAAFGVHQLRYELAFGSGAGHELQITGHSYLHSVTPWLVVALAVAGGAFLRALGRAFRGQTSWPGYTVSFAALWLACAAVLVGIFACQELLEGIFATGHPAGLVGIFGYGGWWAAPAAAAIGLVLAAWFHGARWVLREVARRRATGRVLIPAVAPAFLRPQDVVRVPLAPLVWGRSGRGPPG